MDTQKGKAEYLRRIHIATDYMEQHLDQSLNLDVLSEAAGFSKYHFSRIFQGLIHESLAHYVNRMRLENSQFLLAHRQDKSITDIAYEAGYTDSAVFSRAFKNYYGISPRQYRNQYQEGAEETIQISKYNKEAVQRMKESMGQPVQGTVAIEQLPEMQAVYVRHIGTYESLAREYSQLIQTLFARAGELDLLDEKNSWVFAIYHDNPEFGEEEQYRTSLCLTVPIEKQVGEDEVLGKMMLEGGSYAVGHFRITQEQYPMMWDYMYQEWLCGSGYEPRNSYPFEVYRNNPAEDADHMHEVDLYLPIDLI